MAYNLLEVGGDPIGAADGGDNDWTLESLAAGTGRIGPILEMPAFPRPYIASVTFFAQWASALALGVAIGDLWLLQRYAAAGDLWPGNLTGGDASLTSGKQYNLGMPIMSLLADSTTGEALQVRRVHNVLIYGDEVLPVFLNRHPSIALKGSGIIAGIVIQPYKVGSA